MVSITRKLLSDSVNAINTYYSFAVLVYAFFLYSERHNRFFLLIFIAATFGLAILIGYLIHSFIDQHSIKCGFRLLNTTISYDVSNPKGKVKTHYKSTIIAETDYLFVYPLAYQWSGNGAENLPKSLNPRLRISSIINDESTNKTTGPEPYKLSTARDGEWYYWLLTFNPPLHKGEVTDIDYIQQFDNSDHSAKQTFYYSVESPMKTLELNIRLPNNKSVKEVTCRYFKPTDNRKSYSGTGLIYNEDTHSAQWMIKNPKIGYQYHIDWR